MPRKSSYSICNALQRAHSVSLVPVLIDISSSGKTKGDQGEGLQHMGPTALMRYISRSLPASDKHISESSQQLLEETDLGINTRMYDLQRCWNRSGPLIREASYQP